MIVIGILLIISIAIVVIAAIFVTPNGNKPSAIEHFTDAMKHISDNKKEIEFRRLEVLEKTPELRQLIFHPKIMEKEQIG